MTFRYCSTCHAKGEVESRFWLFGKCGTCGSSKTKHIERSQKRCCHCVHWVNEHRGFCTLLDDVSLCNERCEKWEAKP